MSDSEDDFASADEGESATAKPAEKTSSSPSAADSQKQGALKEPIPEVKESAKTGPGADENELKPTSTKANQEKWGKGKKGKRGKGKQLAQKANVSEKLVHDSSAEKAASKDDNREDINSPDKSEPDRISSKSEPQENLQSENNKTHTYGSGDDSEISHDTNLEISKEPKSDSDKPIVSDNTPTPEESVSNKEEPMDSPPDASLLKSPSSQCIQRPAPDHTDKEEAVLDKLAGAATAKKSGWGWGWGSSLLEVASSSVSTFTKEVGQGIHTMMETVESTLNVPSPEELVRKKELPSEDSDETSTEGQTETKAVTPEDSDSASSQEEQSGSPSDQVTELPAKPEAGNQAGSSGNQAEKNQSKAGGWFSSWGVSNITKMVESTSKNLVAGSLDALESLGKKTFDAINERDPGLKKTRGFLHDRGDKPNLSAVLREAKEQEEQRIEHEKETDEARKAHFGSLFDEFQGLAHLEALEMLSNQCEKRVNALLGSLPPDTLGNLKPTLLKVKANCEIGEEEEEKEQEQEFTLHVTDLIKQLNVGVTADKLVKTHDKVLENLQSVVSESETPDAKVIHQIAISSLAEFTSKSIEQFHKSGELILLSQTELSDFVEVSETLLRLTKVLCTEVSILSTMFTSTLNKQESKDEITINHLVTNIYLEASNSSSYIQDGFQLLLPVLQQAIIERSVEPDQ